MAIQDNATPVDDPLEITGEFMPRSSGGAATAGVVEVTITNIADGRGTATIENDAVSDDQTVVAGSIDNQIKVVFTAEGTMDGGAISLEIPDKWGEMQRDPREANYVDIRAPRGALDGEPGYGARVVIAYLDDFDEGDKLDIPLWGSS